MNGRKLTLRVEDIAIELVVDAPKGVDPIDDYREVCFEIPGKGRYRAVFFLLPDKNSDDPYKTMPIKEWLIPVRWDDPTMLYVPTLDDDSILAALSHILENGLEDDALENEDDIRLDER